MKLSNISTKAPKLISKEKTHDKTEKLKSELFDLQSVLRAESKHGILIVLQGRDAAGKDGTVKRVFSGLDPAGVSVFAFKQPTKMELSHDFLWRVHPIVPPKGMIHIFNRSHYEDI